ncbi:hypothetical protein ACTQZS_07315 [Bilifractor sp. LCP19S3_H10]|uniref:hypothetical protein n=1 Tax=Bilifractor sp. LCP19S3_H10 TaxID=3438736 RepID=UPI003F91F806
MKHTKGIGLQHVLNLGLKKQKSISGFYRDADYFFGNAGKSYLDELIAIEGKVSGK